MNYYAVFFDCGGCPNYNESGELDPVEIGNYDTRNQAIQQAESKLEANHVREGVCLLKDKKKAQCGFMVVSLRELVTEFRQ